MRGAKSLLVLVVVLAGLGAYIYFVESKKPEGGEAAEVRPKVFSAVAEKISEISVEPAGGEKTVARRSGSDWDIVEPAPARADNGEVSGLTTNLATLENVRVVDESPTDLRQYGLAEPRVDIGFKTEGGKGESHLLIGDKTATGGELYAKVGNDKKVFLIAGYLESTFNKSAFDLRDKTALKFDRDKVDRFQVQADGQDVQLTLAGGEWSLAKPIQVPADFGTVEAMVGRLQSLQMKSIAAADAAAGLAQYGLDKPQLTAVLGMGSSQASFLVGKKADEATVYAKDASRPMVFTVESSLLDELKKPADQIRRKDLFTAKAYNTTAVEIARGPDTLAFEKVKGQGKDASEKWRQSRPAAKDVDAARFDTLLTKLANLRAQSWADAKAKTGLDAPVLVVTLKFDEGRREERVSFGKVGTDVYASTGGQPGAAKVDATEFEDAVKALDALK
jgi:hypothetical protein